MMPGTPASLRRRPLRHNGDVQPFGCKPIPIRHDVFQQVTIRESCQFQANGDFRSGRLDQPPDIALVSLFEFKL